MTRLPSWSDFRRKVQSPREGPRWGIWLLQLALVELALVTAFFLRFDFGIPAAMSLPMLWAVLAWSAGHLFANGSGADLLLFGAFLVWSAADLASSYARDRRNGVVYPEPQLSATAGAVVVGLVVYALLIGRLHLWLFGVSPLAM